ncbi:MAG TPA: type III-A CRISPR-associated protein Cas10/Csm1 [Syntrophales bacterium]|jgi:CRISPR-associated protein Csm1|nr:type III-A CRISPR-associated protein Cas10/Csm1 [Syntrophales bacterium]
MKLTPEQEILLAGLFHDVGKVLQRTGVRAGDLGAEDFDYQNLLPMRSGRYTHFHALFSYLFLSDASRGGYLPFSSGMGSDQNLLVMASRHHKPSTPFDWIITEADCLSSGMDRKQYEEAANASTEAGHFIRERLAPVFEEICLTKNKFKDFSFRYPLMPLKDEAIFPRRFEEVIRKDVGEAAAEYGELWKQFRSSLVPADRQGSFERYLESILSSLERYFWCVPSATFGYGGRAWSDISLYDHLVTTSALAHVLYVFHKKSGSLNEDAIKDRRTQKYLFLNVDVSGIQNFIFDITVDAAKGAARMLRARSFFISLLMEGVFRLICRRVGLYSVNRLVDAGGRAIVVAPNLTEHIQKLDDVRREVDEFCLRHFRGELTVNLSWVPASSEDLQMKRFISFLSELNESSQVAKLRKLSGLVGKKEAHLYSDFWQEYKPDKGLCHACGKAQASIPAGDVYYCSWCDLLAELGRRVPSAAYLTYSSGADKSGWAVPVPGGAFELHVRRPEADEKFAQIWALSAAEHGPFGIKEIGCYIPKFRINDPVNDLMKDEKHVSPELREEIRRGITEGLPKTFEVIALSSLRPAIGGSGFRGRPLLSVFKADVDDLGLIFSQGLRASAEEGGNRLTLGRYTTLSRMLDRFFTVYLPHLFASRQEYADIYTIFAGGDDLLLIGPWTRVFRLAGEINSDFRRYTCSNPDVTLSGTLNLMKSRHPVNYMAKVAERGLKKAKNESKDKDSLHLWGEVIPWSLFPRLSGAVDEFDRLLNEPRTKISTGLVYDFMVLKEMKKAFKKDRILRCGNYASLFRYKIGRLAKEKTSPHVIEALTRFYSDFVEGDEPLHLAIQWVLYLNRKSTKGGTE